MAGLQKIMQNKPWFRDGLRYSQKVFLLASLPLLLAAVAIAVLVTNQAHQTATREITRLQDELIAAKRAELKNYLSLARTAIMNVYGRALPDDAGAKLAASQTLAAMLYGQDGFFFVYDYDGNNLVSPRQTDRIGRNWAGTRGPDGQFVVDQMIELARQGGGHLSYGWPKPSTGSIERMEAYVIGLQDWRWVIGTGVFIDDVLATVAAQKTSVQARVQRTFLSIGAITLAALLLVFFSGVWLNLRERRLSDRKLKGLSQRIIDTQEEERGRVARELHDSISQILVGVRYKFELARKRLQNGDERANTDLGNGISSLNCAIQEVRRISHDLRPGMLDDLGLGPALQALLKEFSDRTGIKTNLETVVFRNRLDDESKTAFYRIAQEALTNIERHAGASEVKIKLYGHKRGSTLEIIDNGSGLKRIGGAQSRAGLGLRNMQERMEQLGGKFGCDSSGAGTHIVASVPLSHILSPEGKSND